MKELENLFEKLKPELDVHDSPAGHEMRFMERLNANTATVKKKRSLWQPLSIAASTIILLGISLFFLTSAPQEKGLAAVSPEMKQTESFFTMTIAKELQTLKQFNSPETKALVDDALKQLTILEKEYKTLQKDLTESGNDKRVIYAMIANFQNRIDVLQMVIAQIEDLKTLKTNTDETIL